MIENSVTKQQEVIIKMVLDAWHLKVSQFDKLLVELSDEQLLKEVAPGRNRGIYLLGHLTTLADSIFPLLGFEKQAPHLWKPFVQTSDKDSADVLTVAELRQEWIKVTTMLWEKIAAISSNEWFERHSAISEEDFLKEPHRNKLNIVLSRVSHVDYHLGQIQFLKAR
ncbi:DinB family protein [Paradesertivirga mongoliensis]|uniref:DinB family protein n=1 Tax=Paradesertivirga mongoliensis TaxID=2100740 RepID=A0ABW4ZM71_9SPHI|nr:DinB family protein [Pedobacter mongoliensis]